MPTSSSHSWFRTPNSPLAARTARTVFQLTHNKVGYAVAIDVADGDGAVAVAIYCLADAPPVRTPSSSTPLVPLRKVLLSMVPVR